MREILYMLFLISFLLLSCSQGKFVEIGKKRVIKVSEIKHKKPIVYSFKNRNQISIEWDRVELCDRYFLYRSDTLNGNFSKIYEGSYLSFNDIVVSNSYNKIYYYKTNCSFYDSGETKLSDVNYGFASDLTDDIYEDNNTKEMAKEIGIFETIATIYYIKDNDTEIEDVDWYKVKLPKNSLLQISFSGSGVLSNNDISLIRNDGVEIGVSFGNIYALSNNDNVESDVFFSVIVNKEKMINRSCKYIIYKGQTILN